MQSIDVPLAAVVPAANHCQSSAFECKQWGKRFQPGCLWKGKEKKGGNGSAQVPDQTSVWVRGNEAGVAYQGAGVAATCGALGATARKNGSGPLATVWSHAIDLFAMIEVVYLEKKQRFSQHVARGPVTDRTATHCSQITHTAHTNERHSKWRQDRIAPYIAERKKKIQIHSHESGIGREEGGGNEDTPCVLARRAPCVRPSLEPVQWGGRGRRLAPDVVIEGGVEVSPRL